MKIIWIESDTVFRVIQSDHLATLGYEVYVVCDVEEGISLCRHHEPALLIYDRSFVARDARLHMDRVVERGIPQLWVLCAEEGKHKDSMPEGVQSQNAFLHILIRPVTTEMFIWAIRSFQGQQSCWVSPHQYRLAGLILDEMRREVTLSQYEVAQLTLSELKILRIIMFYPDRVFSVEDLKAVICSGDYSVGNNVQVHIRNIRRKIGKQYIRTIWGGGYSFMKVNHQ